MLPGHMTRRLRFSLLVAALLLGQFGLALHSLRLKSPTFDEQGFLVRGLAYVRGAQTQLRVGHPLGLNALNALPLAADPRVQLPVDDPSWQGTSFHRPAELFLWEIGNHVEQVMFLGRLPTLWLSLLMVAVIGRFSAELCPQPVHKRRATLLAMTLVALDPNILAHSALITTDLGLAAGVVLATYTLWRALRWPAWPNLGLAGIGLGLLLNTKFTAGLCLPLLGVVALVGLAAQWRTQGRLPIRWLCGLLFIYPLIAGLTLWAGNGFDIGPLPTSLPGLGPRLGGHNLPLAGYLTQLGDLGGRLEQATPAFLLGRYSDQGWWYYFPVAFVLKTPAPTLLLLVWALAAAWRSRSRALDVAALAVPSLGYFAFSLTTPINLGYRHILLLVPFIALSVSYRLAHRLSRRSGSAAILLLLLGWLALDTARLAPDFLAYFNPLAGGPDGGWRALVDSNLDWGQDLGGLRDWMAEHGVEQVWLSYFGEARPAYYGIPFRGLPSFPPRLMNPAAQPTSLRVPAPGVYAISATNLQGVLFDDHDALAWFREREPTAKIGYSIFVYTVSAENSRVDLSLGGLGVDDLALTEWQQFDTNDLTLHWFNPTNSLLIPPSTSGWLALTTATALPPALADSLAQQYRLVSAQPGYRLYRRLENAPDLLPKGRLTAPARFELGDGRIDLKQVSLQIESRRLSLLSLWQQAGPPQPVKLFFHLTDSRGALITQWDDLGALWEGWQAGDQLLQNTSLPLPDPLPAGDYDVWAGLYEPASQTRWRAASGDRLHLSRIALP